MVVESIIKNVDGSTRINLMLSYMDTRQFDESMFGKITDAISDAYVEKFSSDIIGKFDQQAIANITIAKIAQKIADKMENKGEEKK